MQLRFRWRFVGPGAPAGSKVASAAAAGGTPGVFEVIRTAAKASSMVDSSRVPGRSDRAAITISPGKDRKRWPDPVCRARRYQTQDGNAGARSPHSIRRRKPVDGHLRGWLPSPAPTSTAATAPAIAIDRLFEPGDPRHVRGRARRCRSPPPSFDPRCMDFGGQDEGLDLPAPQRPRERPRCVPGAGPRST